MRSRGRGILPIGSVGMVIGVDSAILTDLTVENNSRSGRSGLDVSAVRVEKNTVEGDVTGRDYFGAAATALIVIAPRVTPWLGWALCWAGSVALLQGVISGRLVQPSYEPFLQVRHTVGQPCSAQKLLEPWLTPNTVVARKHQNRSEVRFALFKRCFQPVEARVNLTQPEIGPGDRQRRSVVPLATAL